MIPERAIWPASRLGDAIAQLARAADMPLAREAAAFVLPASIARDRAALDPWVDAAARAMGLEVGVLRVRFDEVFASLREAAPSIVAIGGEAEPHFLAIVRPRGKADVELLAPDGTRARAAARDVARVVRASLESTAGPRVDALLDRAGIAGPRRGRARDELLERVLGPRLLDAGWAIGLPPSAPFFRQLADGGVFRAMRAMIAMQIVQQVLGLVGWWLVGRGALEGRIEPGWLLAWGLVLISAIPPRAVAGWAQGIAALGFATLLKRRMMHGALRLEPEETRNEGAGELLGRVIESEAVEALVTSGGLGALLAIVQIVIALGVLAVAPGGVLASIALVGWTLLIAAIARAQAKRMKLWTRARLDLTQDLVERMVGHRTRLAQEPRERWHDGEDERLATYAERATSLDRTAVWMQGMLPRAWLVVGVAAIAPGFVTGGAAAGAQLAVAIGGILLAYRALAQLSSGTVSLLSARVAWEQARPLFEAGGREEKTGAPSWVAASAAPRPGAAVLEARDLHFRYRDRHEPVLRGVNLKIAPRDRLLLEGPSGGGKSTLGAILTGLREPDAGLLLLGGLDPQTLGETGWRRRVVAAPQFHENHVVSATLAFNLLMGRSWPPRDTDLRDAHDVCRELGLGGLLERMPAGLMQMVGETGWQLSHGERSRLFIARALLQKAEVVVLDESFAALDPETLSLALKCVLARAPALLVIAHP